MPSPPLTPSFNIAISFSSWSLEVALSMTSSKTVLPEPNVTTSWLGPAFAPASPASVCCKIAMRVSSGMPGMSFSAMAFNSDDFPEPFLPTSAYLWPAFSLSLALESTSVPSDNLVALALPFPPADLDSPEPEVTVILSPSMSSCDRSLAIPLECRVRPVLPNDLLRWLQYGYTEWCSPLDNLDFQYGTASACRRLGWCQRIQLTLMPCWRDKCGNKIRWNVSRSDAAWRILL